MLKEFFKKLFEKEKLLAPCGCDKIRVSENGSLYITTKDFFCIHMQKRILEMNEVMEKHIKK